MKGRGWIGVALGVWVSSCGGAGDGSGGREPADLETLDPSGQQVVFWYQHTRVREQALQDLMAEYNARNPDRITVRGEFAGDYGDIYNKMVVGLQGGVLPDLVVAYQNQALEYSLAGGIVDLTPYMESPRWGLRPEARADFVQAFLRQDRIRGKQIGLPPNRSVEVLYYNADWLRELGAEGPPSTWDEFATLCRAAAGRPFSRNPDKRRSLGFVLDVDASRMATMTFSRGGDFVNEFGTAYTLNTPELGAAMRQMQELVSEGVVEMMGEAYSDQSDFAAGQALFLLRSTSGLPFVETAVADGLGFEWNVAPPPHATPEPVVNFYGASVSVGRTTPERQLAAWLFLKWFTEPAQQARWVKASNYFPARKSTKALLVDYLEDNPRYARVYELLEYGKAEPSLAGYEGVRRLISQAVVRVLQGADVEPALERLQREANATLEPY